MARGHEGDLRPMEELPVPPAVLRGVRAGDAAVASHPVSGEEVSFTVPAEYHIGDRLVVLVPKL